jgi:membrane protein
MTRTPYIRPDGSLEPASVRLGAPTPEGLVSRSSPRLGLVVAAYHRFTSDHGDGLAASLAFGALLSIAPLLLVVMAAASVVLDEGEARVHLVGLVEDSLGRRAVPVLDRWIEDAQRWSTGATVLGVVLFLLGAARFVGLVESAFETVFHAPPRPPESFADTVKRFFGSQLRSVLVTLAAGLLLVASIALRALGERFVGADASAALSFVWPVLRELGSFTVWALALLLLYRVLPCVPLHRADLLEGALVSAGLVSLALFALRALAGHVDFGAAYGAVGAVIGTLVTLYVVSLIFLFGAELTAELAARRRGGSASSGRLDQS